MDFDIGIRIIFVNNNLSDLVYLLLDKRFDLANSYYKLRVEKSLKVAYIGGSVTNGTGASDEQYCWGANTWFNNTTYEISGCPIRSSLNRLFANIMPKYIYPQYDGAELNFSVTGNSIGIIVTIKEGASVTAVIDGTTTVTFEGSNRTEMTEYPIAINLQNTTHTVKITANGTNPYVTIAAVVVGK